MIWMHDLASFPVAVIKYGQEHLKGAWVCVCSQFKAQTIMVGPDHNGQQEHGEADLITPNQETDRDECKLFLFNPVPFNIVQHHLLRECSHPQLSYVFPVS